MPDVANIWTDKRVELLKKLRADGLSASQIAAELGGITRNAVIGKSARLNLPTRPQAPCASKVVSPQNGSGPNRFRNAAKTAPLTGSPLPVPEVNDHDIALSQRRTLLDLTGTVCRWPIGDPRSAAFAYCGAPITRIGQSYCASHYARAYTRPPRPGMPPLGAPR
jgi:GcrA cell cycle regulator